MNRRHFCQVSTISSLFCFQKSFALEAHSTLPVSHSNDNPNSKSFFFVDPNKTIFSSQNGVCRVLFNLNETIGGWNYDDSYLIYFCANDFYLNSKYILFTKFIGNDYKIVLIDVSDNTPRIISNSILNSVFSKNRDDLIIVGQVTCDPKTHAIALLYRSKDGILIVGYSHTKNSWEKIVTLDAQNYFELDSTIPVLISNFSLFGEKTSTIILDHKNALQEFYCFDGAQLTKMDEITHGQMISTKQGKKNFSLILNSKDPLNSAMISQIKIQHTENQFLPVYIYANVNGDLLGIGWDGSQLCVMAYLENTPFFREHLRCHIYCENENDYLLVHNEKESFLLFLNSEMSDTPVFQTMPLEFESYEHQQIWNKSLYQQFFSLPLLPNQNLFSTKNVFVCCEQDNLIYQYEILLSNKNMSTDHSHQKPLGNTAKALVKFIQTKEFYQKEEASFLSNSTKSWMELKNLQGNFSLTNSLLGRDQFSWMLAYNPPKNPIQLQMHNGGIDGPPTVAERFLPAEPKTPLKPVPASWIENYFGVDGITVRRATDEQMSDSMVSRTSGSDSVILYGSMDSAFRDLCTENSFRESGLNTVKQSFITLLTDDPGTGPEFKKLVDSIENKNPLKGIYFNKQVFIGSPDFRTDLWIRVLFKLSERQSTRALKSGYVKLEFIINSHADPKTLSLISGFTVTEFVLPPRMDVSFF